MAKKFSHAVCGRTFRTANGKKTHVNCTPIAKNTPAPAAKQNAPAQVSDEKATVKRMIETATSYYMREYELGFVKANIRARRLLARKIAAVS